VHRKDADTKGQQPSIIVNPLQHNGIIGSRSGQVKRSPLLARDCARQPWCGTPECLVFVRF
jgi:hypothetical protein